MNKKLFALFLVIPFSFASCGVHVSQIVWDANIDQWYDANNNEINIDEKVTIRWWTWGGRAAEIIFTNVAKTFSEEVDPNIKVVYTCHPSSSYLTKLTNSANNLPDLFFLPDTDFYRYAYTGVIWDFSKYITDEEISDVWEDAYERYLYNRETKLVGKSEGAGLYALPKDISTFTLCYNEDLLKKACRETEGITYEQIYSEYLNDKVAMTWEKFIELGHLIQPWCKKNSKQFLSHYELNPALFSNNADFLNDDGTESRIDEPQFADALDFMHSLAFEHSLMAGAAGSDTTKGYNSFVAQTSMFSFFGPWDCENFWGVTAENPHGMGFEVKLLPVPYGPGADKVYGTEDDGYSCGQIGSAGYCISAKDTTSNLQRAAALKFCKWLTTSEEAQRELYKKGTQLPNLKHMEDEYVAYGEKQITTYDGSKISATPSNLSVFLDVVNGTSENDRIGGRAKTETRILTNEYKLDWASVVGETKFWSRRDAKGQELVDAFRSTLQSRINDSNNALGRK